MISVCHIHATITIKIILMRRILIIAMLFLHLKTVLWLILIITASFFKLFEIPRRTKIKINTLFLGIILVILSSLSIFIIIVNFFRIFAFFSVVIWKKIIISFTNCGLVCSIFLILVLELKVFFSKSWSLGYLPFVPKLFSLTLYFLNHRCQSIFIIIKILWANTWITKIRQYCWY